MFISFPSAYVFANHLNLGIDGLWYGLGVGLVVLSISFANIIFKSDWESIASSIRDDMKYDLMRNNDDYK